MDIQQDIQHVYTTPTAPLAEWLGQKLGPVNFLLGLCGFNPSHPQHMLCHEQFNEASLPAYDMDILPESDLDSAPGATTEPPPLPRQSRHRRAAGPGVIQVQVQVGSSIKLAHQRVSCVCFTVKVVVSSAGIYACHM